MYRTLPLSWGFPGNIFTRCLKTIWEKARPVFERLDFIFYDIKLFSSELHEKNTGVPNRLILENFTRLCEEFPDKSITVRTPVIPGVNDDVQQLQTIADFFKGLFVPDYDMFLGTGVYSFETSVVYLCLQTFAIAFLGTLFASILAVPFGFLASKKLFGKWSYFSTAVLILIRTVPEIVFCYIMIMVTGFSPITGVVVLSIQSIGMVGKMYSDGLDGMDMTFLEAYDSCGSTRFGSIRVGVLPQVLPSFLSTILYRFDLNLRTASILGLVGAGDLGRLILRFSSEHKWPQLGSLMWGLIVMIVLVDLVSTQIRKKLV